MHGRHHPDGPRLLSEVLRIGASQGGCLGVSGGRFRIALVGLAFGAEFAPIYRDRPDVESVTICDSNKGRSSTAPEIGSASPIALRRLTKVLERDDVDAVRRRGRSNAGWRRSPCASADLPAATGQAPPVEESSRRGGSGRARMEREPHECGRLTRLGGRGCGSLSILPARQRGWPPCPELDRAL